MIKDNKFVENNIVMNEDEKMVSLRQNDSNNYNTKQIRIHKIAMLIKELIGERSIRKTAEDTGVTAAYITGILKEKYLPSAEILKKLTAPGSKVQNGVLLEDLMIAAGYQDKYSEEVSADDIEEERINRIQRHREYENDRKNFERIAKGLICNALLDKGFRFKMIDDRYIGVRGFVADIAVEIEDEYVKEWWFDIRFIEKKNNASGFSINNQVRHLLYRYIFVEPKDNRKLSVVINSEKEFEALKEYKNKLSYKGDLSIILIDPDDYSIKDEIYVAFENNECQPCISVI